MLYAGVLLSWTADLIDFEREEPPHNPGRAPARRTLINPEPPFQESSSEKNRSATPPETPTAAGEGGAVASTRAAGEGGSNRSVQLAKEERLHRVEERLRRLEEGRRLRQKQFRKMVEERSALVGFLVKERESEEGRGIIPERFPGHCRGPK